MFGVMTVASGNSLEVSAATASSSMSLAPEVATITGSSTMFRAWCADRRSAIVSIRSALDTIPILTAIGGMSSNTASTCSASTRGSAFCTSRTPVVFCAVSEVMADMPNTPLAIIVFRSA